jgi:glycosyltransferase involved in cell wall biosynthesis
MADNKPRVGIGMPVYDEERFIREALDSTLSQSFQDFEIIIYDNASSDHTGDICLEYAAKDPRIRWGR